MRFSQSEQHLSHQEMLQRMNAQSKALRNWGISINEAFFLGGVSKTEVLAAFGAHIFFDDQDIHTEPASAVVPAATVPYRDGDNPKE